MPRRRILAVDHPFGQILPSVKFSFGFQYADTQGRDIGWSKLNAEFGILMAFNKAAPASGVVRVTKAIKHGPVQSAR